MQRLVGFGEEPGRHRGWRTVPQHRGWIWFSLAILFTFMVAISALLFLETGAMSTDDPKPVPELTPNADPALEPAPDPADGATPTLTQP